MEITAAMVRELRERTGLPMMECKKALQEAGGDSDKAIEILRKKGLAQITKRAGKQTSEGRVACHVDPDTGRAALIEMLCETAPVADTEDFQRLTQAVAETAAKLDSSTADDILGQPMPGADASGTIGDFLHDVVNRIRENIKIGRVGVCTGETGYYVHHDSKKGVLVEFSGSCPGDVKSGVCMHIVAMRPPYLKREDVDATAVERERELAKEQVAGKPENIIDKIVTGKLNKWYSEIVLLEQPYVVDDKKSVGQALREAGPELTISRFERFEIGGD